MCVGVTLLFGWGGVVWYPDAVGLSLFNYQDDARSNKHKISLNMLWIYVIAVYWGNQTKKQYAVWAECEGA
jgi:hypothetical protein